MRPSDDTRSHTLAALRRGYVSGRLHTDTFSLRVDRALTADSRGELNELAADLPHRRWRDRIELRDGRWFVVDLDSSNGTLVNGRRVRDAEVRAGDEIRLGAAGFTL